MAADETIEWEKYYYSGSVRLAIPLHGASGDFVREDSDSALYLITNHLGSTSLVIDTSGQEVAKRSYLPFGETWGVSATEIPTDYTYTGQSESFETGLVYYKSRWYDSKIGHFVQADTIIPDVWSAQAWNKYSYVNYNPINSIDPTGHLTEEQIKEYTRRDKDDFTPDIWAMLLAPHPNDRLSGYIGDRYYNYGFFDLDESGHIVFGGFSLNDIIAKHGELYLTRTVGDSSWVSWSSWGISDNEGPDNFKQVVSDVYNVGPEWEDLVTVLGGLIGYYYPISGIAAWKSMLLGIGSGVATNHIKIPGAASGDIIITNAYSNSPGEIWYQRTIIRNDQIISYKEIFTNNDPISEFPYGNW